MHSEANHSVRLAAYAGCLCAPQRRMELHSLFTCSGSRVQRLPRYAGSYPRCRLLLDCWHTTSPAFQRALAPPFLAKTSTEKHVPPVFRGFHQNSRVQQAENRPMREQQRDSNLVITFLASLLHTRIGGSTHTRACSSTGSFNKQENSRQLILFLSRRGYSAPKQAL